MKQVIRRHVAVLLVIFLVSTVWAQQAKYVFYFIGDGMGVNQVNGAEMYLAEQEGRIGVKPLLFTTFSLTAFFMLFMVCSNEEPIREVDNAPFKSSFNVV